MCVLLHCEVRDVAALVHVAGTTTVAFGEALEMVCSNPAPVHGPGRDLAQISSVELGRRSEHGDDIKGLVT
jgi:hypothetical protein